MDAIRSISKRPSGSLVTGARAFAVNPAGFAAERLTP